jgi:hypothetical protein
VRKTENIVVRERGAQLEQQWRKKEKTKNKEKKITKTPPQILVKFVW